MPRPVLLLLLLAASAGAAFPRFRFTIRENSVVGTRVGSLLTFAGAPSGVTPAKLARVVKSEGQAYCRGKFDVDTRSGAIVVRERPDREAMCGRLSVCACELSLILTDDSIVKVDIRVADENDHAPRFLMPVKAITVSEAAAVGYEHSLDLALDPDLPPNDVKQYSLQVRHDAFRVAFNRDTAELKLVLKRRLDHETVAKYNATLDACDGAPVRRCGSQRLVIAVKDENDNAPLFEKERYVVDVAENTTMGTRVARLRATDADAGENGRVTYAMRASQKAMLGPWFHVDDTTGDVYLKAKLSFRKQRKYDILIDAMDHGNSPRKKTATLTINVKDLNDHPPEIRLKRLTGDRVEITENRDADEPIAHLIVTDNDDPSSPGGQFDCVLSRGDEFFKLERIMEEPITSIYALQPTGKFNRERTTIVTTHVNCQDRGRPPLSARKEVQVFIKDENEFAPTFISHNFSRSIPENRHVGEFVLRVSARDQDADAQLRYALDKDGKQYFRIDRRTGDVFTLSSLDREVVSVINFCVLVTDAEQPPVHSVSASVRVNVLDSNDNAPKVVGRRRFSVEENQGEYHLGNLQATDPDAGENGRVAFRLLGVRKGKKRPLLPSETFSLTDDGALSVTGSLDREAVSQFLLEVLVHDLGSPQQNTSSTVIVDVLDQNDNDPVWTHPAERGAVKNVSDAVKPGDVVTRVHARDDDVIRNVTYHLAEDSQGRFQVGLLDGKLRVASLLKPGTYRLLLVASDNGEHARTAQMPFTINVVRHETVSLAGAHSPMNFTLVVGMIAATCVISISLLIAIFIVRRRTRSARLPKAEMASWAADDTLYPTNGSVYPLSNQNYYQGAPMTSFGQTEKVNGHATIRALPTDMEVASADSGHGASEEENGQQAALGCSGGAPGDLKLVRADYRPHMVNTRACPILPEDSVIQCGCGDTIDLAGNTVHARVSAGSHHSIGCAMSAASGAPPAYHLATGGPASFRTFPRVPRAALPEGSGSIDGSLSRLCHSPQTNV